MRLIDADALSENLGFAKNCKDCKIGKNCAYETFRVYGICTALADAPTVDILQKLWNALYAEEDKLEKRYIRTSEHDNWFLVYRPWLQDGFGIAIKALSEIFTPKPLKENKDAAD